MNLVNPFRGFLQLCEKEFISPCCCLLTSEVDSNREDEHFMRYNVPGLTPVIPGYVSECVVESDPRGYTVERAKRELQPSSEMV